MGYPHRSMEQDASEAAFAFAAAVPAAAAAAVEW